MSETDMNAVINGRAYDSIIERWAKARDKSSINQCIIDFAKRIPTGGRILDIGCGTGYPIAKYLAEQGYEVTGFDISSKMIEKAVALKLANARFCVSDFFAFQTSEKFDGVVAFDSLFHISKEMQPRIYERIASWMNAGAYLIFTHGKAMGEIVDSMFDANFYYSALDVDAVKGLLEKSGFRVVSLITDYKEKTTGTRDLLVVAEMTGWTARV